MKKRYADTIRSAYAELLGPIAVSFAGEVLPLLCDQAEILYERSQPELRALDGETLRFSGGALPPHAFLAGYLLDGEEDAARALILALYGTAGRSTLFISGLGEESMTLVSVKFLPQEGRVRCELRFVRTEEAVSA